MTPDLIPEPELARQTGAPRRRIAELRGQRLTEGADWSRSGTVVGYTPAGRAKLFTLLGLELDAPAPAPTAAFHAPAVALVVSPEKTPPRAAVVLVVLRRLTNPKLIRCRIPGGAEADCRVRDNRNFIPNMRVEAWPPLPGDGLWAYHGRGPRYHGKW